MCQLARAPSCNSAPRKWRKQSSCATMPHCSCCCCNVYAAPHMPHTSRHHLSRPHTRAMVSILSQLQTQMRTRRWQSGECRFGDMCNFAHGEAELRPMPPRGGQGGGRGHFDDRGGGGPAGPGGGGGGCAHLAQIHVPVSTCYTQKAP